LYNTDQKGALLVDYVFFGFSSLCLGFSILLLFHLSEKTDRPSQIWQLVVAVVAVIFYYYLEITVFRDQLVLYYLFNSLPQGLLLLLLVITLLRRRNARRS
jgi:uncharacterized membrane protein HdeD (DUF308 family)